MPNDTAVIYRERSLKVVPENKHCAGIVTRADAAQPATQLESTQAQAIDSATVKWAGAYAIAKASPTPAAPTRWRKVLKLPDLPAGAAAIARTITPTSPRRERAR